jgi:hypothetical protein
VLCITDKQRDDADIGSRTGLWSQKENRITVGQSKMEAEEDGNGRAQIVLASPCESGRSDYI